MTTPKTPEAATEEQVTTLMNVFIPFVQRATDITTYLKVHDREMRERGVVALEDIASALKRAFPARAQAKRKTKK